MENACPDCGRRSRTTAPRIRVGYCPHCDSWLGREGGTPRPRLLWDPEWQLWLSRVMEDLLKRTQIMVSPLPHAIPKVLRQYTATECGGRTIILRDRLRCFESRFALSFAEGTTPFDWAWLMRVCRLLKLSPTSFLTGTVCLDPTSPTCAEIWEHGMCRGWCTTRKDEAPLPTR